MAHSFETVSKQNQMAAFITSANPPTKDTLSVRQFNICQYDLLGSTQVCTAIAMVAAREVHKAHGDFDAVFRTDTQVMEILSEGVVWHSRWLALDTNGTRTAFEADTESEEADPNLVSMATPDEICALPGMPMDVTDVRYDGTLIPQAGKEHFGYSVTEAVNFIFNPPRRKPWESDEEETAGESSQAKSDADAAGGLANGGANGAAAHSVSGQEVSKAAVANGSGNGIAAPVSARERGEAERTTTTTTTPGAVPSKPPPRPPAPAPSSSSPMPGDPDTSPRPWQTRRSGGDAAAAARAEQEARDAKLSIKKLVSEFSLFGARPDKDKKGDETVDTFIFTSRGYSTLIARRGNHAMVFDSHQRDKRGMANKDEGKAVCVFCEGPTALARYLRALYGTKPLALFTMQQVVPKECDEDMKQYGATSMHRKVQPPVETPPAQPHSSMSTMAANAQQAAAKGFAEIGTSLRKFSGSLFSS